MKNIYIQMVNTESQKSHPFGLAEKRFNWVKIYSNGDDLKKHKRIYRNKMKDNLEGGLSKFLSKNRFLNERNNNMNNNFLKKTYKYLNVNSQRVIYPEKDTEVKRINKKRTYASIDRTFNKKNKGTYYSLLDKTPLKPIEKGKKVLINTCVNGRKKDTKLFSESFLNDPKYNRIPGVDRKQCVGNITNETEPINEFAYGKRHFATKFVNNSVIY